MVRGGDEASQPDGRGTSASWYASSLIALAAITFISSSPSEGGGGGGRFSGGWMVTTLSKPTHSVFLFPDVYKSSQNNTLGKYLPPFIPGLMANLRKSSTQLNPAKLDLCRLGKTMVDIAAVWGPVEASG